MVAALHQKLRRELWQLKSQMLSIALVVATGVMTVITMRGGYESLVTAQRDYYQQTRFADVWVSVRRAPDSLLPQLARVPGVALVDTRISRMATLDLPDIDAPAIGRFVSLPEQGRPLLNDIVIQQGRYPDHAASDEVLINKKFATARQLGPGDSIRAIINGRARELDIVGTAISPEHVYAMPPGALMPDDQRYGILWMGERALEAAWDMDGAFNEAFFRLTPDANTMEVISAVNGLLDPFGSQGAYTRRDQPSHLILQGELDQNRVMGTAIPAVFLGIAVFLLHLVLSRLITTQRSEIAVLKAFGYYDSEVGTHYFLFAVAAVLAGIAIGGVGGIALGQAYIGIYQQYFDFPDLAYRTSWQLLLAAAAINLLGAVSGAISAVLKAARLPPAEAMRPQAPATYRAGSIERLGLTKQLPASARMILRNIERKPWQTLLSTIGVAFSVAILVIGFFMFDGIRYLMTVQFQEIQREDVAVTFYESQSDSVMHELWRLPGVTHAEPIRSAPARLVSSHLHRDIGITGLPPDNQLRRLIARGGLQQPLPPEGLVVSRLLAQRLDISIGDMLQVQMLEGQRRKTNVVVGGIVDDYMGINAYMSLSALDDLSGQQHLVNGALLSVQDDQRDALYRTLKAMPLVAGVASPEDTLRSFEQEMAQSIFVSVGFLVGFASVIAVGVIYNGARIALSERGRELASLRVMGFHHREVARLLLGEQALITLAAIPLGWLIGYALAWAVVQGMQTDLFRLPYVVNVDTLWYSAGIIVIAAISSALAVRRRLDRFDLISVLKTRE